MLYIFIETGTDGRECIIASSVLPTEDNIYEVEDNSFAVAIDRWTNKETQFNVFQNVLRASGVAFTAI